MSQFTFLQREWEAVFEAASKAEAAVHGDPRTACFYARRALELAVHWAYKHDPGLKLPYQDNLSALIHEPSFKQTALIQDVQTDEWWQDVTVPMLELARLRLRNLIKLIEKQRRKPIYTDFEDVMGDESEVALPVFATGTDMAKFKAKARAFLRAHEAHIAIHRLRNNKPLTKSDLDELERMLVESGVGSPEIVDQAIRESQGLGLFVRRLVGLDREAAKAAFAQFLDGKILSANQIEFVNLVVEHLTEHGVMAPEMLYESPFTDITPRGPEGLFDAQQVAQLVAILDDVKESALTA